MGKHFSLAFLLSIFLSGGILAQVTISGKITDDQSGDALIGATVVIKGTTEGTSTDLDGNFSFSTNRALPLDLIVNYIGYNAFELTYAEAGAPLKIRLEPSSALLETVEVIEFRISEKEKESPTTVEAMDLLSIKETAAATFYDGLGNLKGVDITAASMGFKIINTRGFNSTSPVRTLQTVDGVDNQAPGLNFSVGNFAGASELDINRVELMVGANSALYGPNAFNGAILMMTKDPFDYQGLSVMAKAGERNLRETAIRYARGYKVFGKDYENLAFKLNFSYMEANDWEADNYDPVFDAESSADNWGGYDAVNRYGDEVKVGSTTLSSQRLYPGLGVYHRTGYNEVDLVDYNTNNLKLSGDIHYKFKNDVVIKGSYHYGTGTTVYQGDNRYSLKDLQIHQQIVEVGKKDKFFVRAYNTSENAGQSYDAVFTALLLQNAAKSDASWSQDYLSYYERNIVKRIRQLEGFPSQNDYFNFGTDPVTPNYEAYSTASSILQQFSDSLAKWHQETRAFADGVGNPVGIGVRQPFYEVGTSRFDSAFSSITSRLTFGQGGSGFYDQSALSHIQGQYTFEPEFADIILGANVRQYRPDSRGTIFSDTNGQVIRNREGGIYGSIQKRILDERLILTGSGRLDKNENFNFLFSPAVSGVYKVDEKSSFRLSLSSAIRNPTLQDQYLYYNTGRALLVGNLNGWDSLVTPESFLDYNRSQNRDTLDYFSVNPVRPEQVRTVEVGYKGVFFDNIYVDASYYFSWYRYFLGYRIGADLTFDSLGLLQLGETQFYRVSANSPDVVTTQGFSIGVNYYFWKYYALTGNYSWNVLDKRGSDDEIIPAFNTPEHKYNISFSGRDLSYNVLGMRIRNVGFNITYKWIQGFLFEGSPQFTGTIPTYDLLDAQVSYNAKKINTVFKLGASNILNKMNFQTYGGPRVGRLAYFSATFDLDREK